MNCRHALVLISAFLGGLLVLGACADQEKGIVLPDSRSTAAVSVEGLARAFALGMANVQARDAVRDAMRASPLTDHKLSLKEFVASPEGQVLLRAAAVANATDLDEIKATIAGLPDLDFYLPVRQHRLTWRGSADYLVAVNVNGNAPTNAYQADGSSIPLDVTQSEPPRQALFLLETAETKSRRINAQPDVPGMVVQDGNDGEISGTLLMVDARGAAKLYQLAELAANRNVAKEQCYEDCGGGGGPPGPETFLTRIQTDGIVDNNFPWETNEFEFNATSWDGSTGFLRLEGIPSTTDQVRHDHLIYSIPISTVSVISVSAKETDGWPNPDDRFALVTNGSTYCGPVPVDVNSNGALWGLSQVADPPCTFNPRLGLGFGW